ncbi:MAG: nitroreductase family protein [Solirubrobacterales bacterium]|nr:nitroreductase family protein [Solirubrobacterales bacterium]
MRLSEAKGAEIDTYLAIASKRDLRRYREEPLTAEAVERILQAGRVAGSGKNRQARRFIVLREAQADAAELVTRPGNVSGAALVVAIVVAKGSWSGFDAARVAQNMMLAAWNDGVASCPNAIADADGFVALLALTPEEEVAVLISFGLPARGFDPDTKTAEEWLEAADRVPLDELVEYR